MERLLSIFYVSSVLLLFAIAYVREGLFCLAGRVVGADDAGLALLPAVSDPPPARDALLLLRLKHKIPLKTLRRAVLCFPAEQSRHAGKWKRNAEL